MSIWVSKLLLNFDTVTNRIEQAKKLSSSQYRCYLEKLETETY